MSKITLFAILAVFLLPTSAHAGIEWINGAVCPNDCKKTVIPFLQGRETQYTLKGQFLSTVIEVEGLGSQIDYRITQGVESTGPNHLWDKIETLAISLNVGAATAGEREIRLKTALGVEVDRLKIYIVPAGTYSALDIWPVKNYFKEATFLVMGSKLSNAKVEIAGWPQGTTATLVSAAPPPYDNVAQIKMTFATYFAEASGDFILYDKGMPSLCKNLLATYAYKVTGSTLIRKRVTIQGPNAIKSIGFVGGPAYNNGETITIRLTFYRPLDQQAVIYWKLGANSGKVSAQAVSPTTYNPNADFNQRTAGAGATFADIKIKICGCLGGSWNVPIQTWFGSTDTNTAPAFKESNFSVTCPSGGAATCQ